jgi:hypothetical protein
MNEIHQTRTCPVLTVCFRFALQDQGAFRVVGGLGASVFHASLPVGSQEVETKTVCGRVDDIEELGAKLNPKGWFQQAFKDRELHPLTMILTQFGDMPKATFSVD